MKGKDWHGTDINLTARLQPFLSAVIARQARLGESGRQTSTRAGHSATWWFDVTARHAMINPSLSRMAQVAEVLFIQEFGLFLFADDEYSTYTLHDIEAPDANQSRISMGRKVYDFRRPLKPLCELLTQRRRVLYRTPKEFAAVNGFERTTITGLESPKKNYNPSLARLSFWAQALQVQEFGVYLLIDGEYTEVDVLHDNETEDGE